MFSIFGSNELSAVRMHFITWNVFLNFYLTHFEKYNTGVLYLPHAYDFTMWVSFNNISRSNEIIELLLYELLYYHFKLISGRNYCSYDNWCVII